MMVNETLFCILAEVQENGMCSDACLFNDSGHANYFVCIIILSVYCDLIFYQARQ